MSTATRTLALAAVAVTLSVPQPSSAQLYEGSTNFKIVSSGTEIGAISVTGASPPTGYAADSEYWDWDSGSWPATDFNIAYDSTASAASTADYTDDADFPASATTALPSSIGGNDEMYAVSVCTGTPPDCTGAGYLWVEDDGATLHWYLRSDWSIDRFIDDLQTETMHFDHLTAAPSNNDDFRYLELDRQ